MAKTGQETSIIKILLSRYLFPIYLLLLQCIFIVLYAVHAEYGIQRNAVEVNTSLLRPTRAAGDEGPVLGDVEFFYPFFQDIHVMMFIGFGFLMTFLRRYSFSSVAFNFLVAAFVIEWAILVRGYVYNWDSQTTSFPVDVESLILADFAAAAVLISFGAVLGKTTPAQLITLALIEVVIQVWNQYVNIKYFCIYDIGE